MTSLSEIQARLDAATPGPWTWETYAGMISRTNGADAEFIAHAPTDIAWLLAELKAEEQAHDLTTKMYVKALDENKRLLAQVESTQTAERAHYKTALEHMHTIERLEAENRRLLAEVSELRETTDRYKTELSSYRAIAEAAEVAVGCAEYALMVTSEENTADALAVIKDFRAALVNPQQEEPPVKGAET